MKMQIIQNNQRIVKKKKKKNLQKKKKKKSKKKKVLKKKKKKNRFQQINQAYFILSDPERREIYDTQYNEYCIAAGSNFEREQTNSKKCRKNEKN